MVTLGQCFFVDNEEGQLAVASTLTPSPDVSDGEDLNSMLLKSLSQAYVLSSNHGRAAIRGVSSCEHFEIVENFRFSSNLVCCLHAFCNPEGQSGL